METYTYISKSASILTLFYLVYLIVLRKDTFFSANRHYLIGGIIASIVLPLVVFTNTVYVDAPIINELSKSTNDSIINPIVTTETNSIDWLSILTIIYMIGMMVMSIRFLKQFISLYLLIANHPQKRINGFRFIKVTENITPFSFFKYIVYNPEKHSESDLKMILKHEESHASQHHSIDILLSNMLLIVQWMNPFAWLYKKSMEENLEFIADSETVQQIPKTEYQLTLLKTISSGTLQPILANNFYQSLIKKRIIMLHKNQSSNKKQWKLLIILPLLGVFLWSFNVEEEIKYNDYSTSELIEHKTPLVDLIKEEKAVLNTTESVSSKKIKTNNVITTPAIISEKTEKATIDNKITVTVDKNTTDEELESLKKMFKTNYKVTLDFTNVKRNSSGEITMINVTMTSKKSNANFNQNDTDGIHEFMISYDQKKGSIEIGNHKSHDVHYKTKSGNEVIYDIKDEHGNVSTWTSKDGKTTKTGKGHYVIHESHNDGEGNHEVRVISGSGGETNVWVTDEGNVSKKVTKTIIIESDGEHEDENIFIIDSDEHNEDSIFVVNGDEDHIFISNDGDKKPLIYIDGKKSNSRKMEKLGGNAIEKVEVIKGDQAIEKYGEKAKDGVILITTKKN